MAVLSHTCPHCHFDVAFEIHHQRIDQQKGRHWITLACPQCHAGALAEITGGFPGGSTSSVAGDVRKVSGFALHSFSPQVPPIKAPSHLDEKVQSAYLEAMHNLEGKRWNSAGMMFRRAIEVATKILLPDFKGDLYKRIDQLASTHDLTPSMHKWAHHIRLEGNAAAHDLEEITESDAKSLQAFTELFLTYQFSLPAMLAEHYANGTAKPSA